jgi:hypothetical protein
MNLRGMRERVAVKNKISITGLNFLVLVFLFFGGGNAQSFDWIGRLDKPQPGSGFYFVEKTSAGDIYTAGAFKGSITINQTTFHTDKEASYLAMQSSDGDFLWVVQQDFRILSMQVDKNDELLVTGDGDFDGPDKYFFAKINSQGEVEWLNTSYFPLSYHDVNANNEGLLTGIFFNSIQLDSIHLTSSCHNCIEDYVARTNSEGRFTWAKPLGHSDKIYLKGAAVDEFDNFYIEGNFKDSLIINGVCYDSSKAQQNYFIAQLDLHGNVLWTKKIVRGADDNKNMQIDKFGSIYTSCLFSDSVMVEGAVIHDEFCSGLCSKTIFLKLTNSGSLIWYNTLSVKGESDYIKFAISDDAQLVISGPVKDAVWLGDTVLYNNNTSSDWWNSHAVFFAGLNNEGKVVWSSMITSPGKISVLHLSAIKNSSVNFIGFVYGNYFVAGDKIIDAGASGRVFSGQLNAPAALPGYRENEFTDNAVLVFPNPCSESLTISLQFVTTQEIEIALHNLFGEKVYSTTIINFPESGVLVPTEKLPSGVYSVTIKQGSFFRGSRVIIIN